MILLCSIPHPSPPTQHFSKSQIIAAITVFPSSATLPSVKGKEAGLDQEIFPTRCRPERVKGKGEEASWESRRLPYTSKTVLANLMGSSQSKIAQQEVSTALGRNGQALNSCCTQSLAKDGQGKAWPGLNRYDGSWRHCSWRLLQYLFLLISSNDSFDWRDVMNKYSSCYPRSWQCRKVKRHVHYKEVIPIA